MSTNPSRAKRSAVANSLAASFPVTLQAAALRRHVAKMEWQAADRAHEKRKRAEIDAQKAFDNEIARIVDIARSNEGPSITKLYRFGGALRVTQKAPLSMTFATL